MGAFALLYIVSPDLYLRSLAKILDENNYGTRGTHVKTANTENILYLLFYHA